MNIPNYAHRVSTFQKEGAWFVRIERLLPDGTVNWLNDQELPTSGKHQDWDLFESFMGDVGKTLGIDSPGVRAHFRIDED